MKTHQLSGTYDLRSLLRETKPKIVRPEPSSIKLAGSGTGDPPPPPGSVKVVVMELATMVKSCPPAPGATDIVIRLEPMMQKPPVFQQA